MWIQVSRPYGEWLDGYESDNHDCNHHGLNPANFCRDFQQVPVSVGIGLGTLAFLSLSLGVNIYYTFCLFRPS